MWEVREKNAFRQSVRWNTVAPSINPTVASLVGCGIVGINQDTMAVWSFTLIMRPLCPWTKTDTRTNAHANKSFYFLRLVLAQRKGRNQWKEGGDPRRPFALVSSIEFSSQPFSEWRKIKNSSTHQTKVACQKALHLGISLKVDAREACSRLLARLASLAHIGELARRLD